MSSNVTKLEVVGSKLEPDEETIKRLEALVEKAKTGELRSFFFVGLCADGSTWEQDNGVPGDNFYKLLRRAHFPSSGGACLDSRTRGCRQLMRA